LYTADRTDVAKDSNEIFFRKIKFWEDGGDAPPAFNVEGINFIWIKQSGLFFACTTKFNVSPNFTVEFLLRLAKVFKDYCGVLSEESMRKNFVLIYELLDETLDYGYAQGTSTELLKACIHNEPVSVVEDNIASSLIAMSRNQKTKSSSAANKSVLARSKDKKENEIFVDIIERLNIMFDDKGVVLNSSIDGTIQMKSFLSGNPPLRLALNEDLVIGKGNGNGSVILDDATFHEVAKLDEFEKTKVIDFTPPDGEFSLINYRMTNEYRPPIKIYALIDTISETVLDVLIKVRAEIPDSNYAGNMLVSFNVPKTAASVTPTIQPNDIHVSDPKAAAELQMNAEYSSKDMEVLWRVKRLKGGHEVCLRTRISLSSPASTYIRKQIGPIVVDFEIPMYNASRLTVKYLRIHPPQKDYTPQRWVRYITQAGSYVCRL
jgi:AP-4 complex subunit mu-1